MHLQTDRIWGQHIKVMRPPEMIREIWGATDWNERTNEKNGSIFWVFSELFRALYFLRQGSLDLPVRILWILSHHRTEENLGI